MDPSDMAFCTANVGKPTAVPTPDSTDGASGQAVFETTLLPDFNAQTNAAVPFAARLPPEGQQACNSTNGVSQYRMSAFMLQQHAEQTHASVGVMSCIVADLNSHVVVYTIDNQYTGTRLHVRSLQSLPQDTLGSVSMLHI